MEEEIFEAEYGYEVPVPENAPSVVEETVPEEPELPENEFNALMVIESQKSQFVSIDLEKARKDLEQAANVVKAISGAIEGCDVMIARVLQQYGVSYVKYNEQKERLRGNVVAFPKQ